MVREPKKIPDPSHTLALLWRDPSKAPRGPRPGLSVEDVVAAAIALADAHGVEGVTIRAVASALGVASMSIYTYVPGKAELLLLMHDAALRDMPTTRAKKGWRARVRALARDNRALFEAHPWLTGLPPNRPALGPGTLTKYERELHAFDDTGLDDVTIDAALTWVLGFVEASAHAATRARTALRDQSDAEWWASNGPTLERVVDPTTYPLATRIGQASAAAMQSSYDPERAFTFGLARVIDGLAALIER